jgi:transposase
MEIVYERCSGFDVHKKTVVVCLITPDERGQRHKEIRTFRTMTKDLLELLDWLQERGCTHIAMESTGVYWKPLYNLFEGHFELLLVNAQHIKAVPGRKTDVRDAEWIADLLQHGLLTGSFIPPIEQRHLRELTRHRTNLVEDRARVVNRLQKVLEDTNLKLGDVATDITGKSARTMLEAILAGQTDPVALANLARGRLKAKRAQLEDALVGVVKPHHRFLLTELLAQLDTLEEAIERTSQEIATRMQEFGPDEPGADRLDQETLDAHPPESEPRVLTWTLAVVLLCSIPGVSRRIAEGVLAEIGLDMTRFPSAGHLSSWAGMCPGNHESAGKRLSGKTRKGSPYLRTLLVEAAHAAAHTKHTYLSAQYHRLAARRGKKKAMIAVGHTILVVIYHMLSRQKSYEELGSNYFDEQERQSVEKRLVRRLEKLGYQVELQPTTQVA